MQEQTPATPVIWIFLPAFNEEKSLPPLLEKTAAAMTSNDLEYRVVVVDDGSTDATPAVLKELSKTYPIETITHSMNRGLGETERDGFEYLADKTHENDIIVRMDCDDTHDPEYIPVLLNKLTEGYDAVNTSRFQPGGDQKGVSKYRAVISSMANLFMRIVFNIPNVKDYSCGFRAYRASIIKGAIAVFGNGFIQLKGLGFTSTLEMLVKLKMLGGRFAEVPFVLRYDRKLSCSKMVTSVTTMGYLVMAVLYHWPIGGWRHFYKGLAETYARSPEQARIKFDLVKARPMACRIGG